MVKTKSQFRHSTVMEFRDLSTDSDLEKDGPASDGDDCDEIELRTSFKKTYKIIAEKALTLNKNYILHISCTSEAEPKICVGVSDHICEIHNLSNNQLIKTATLDSHTNSIINVKFGSDPNLVYTGSIDGSIKLWDLRSPKTSILNFVDNTGQVKPLTCFDLAADNRLICAGTELVEGDAYLLFWDTRSANLLGGYWETHTDDITSVLFHPEDNNKLASGSTDGLINIFNIKEANEDDALTNTFNTNSSVDQLTWYKQDSADAICCVTHTADVQLWDTDEATQYKTFSRSTITKEIHRKSPEHLYIASAYTSKTNNHLCLLVGSNWNHGECVRGLKAQNSVHLLPNYRLLENKQRIRACWYHKELDLLVTGGEQSILSIWQSSESNFEDIPTLKNLKEKVKRVQPY